MMSIPGYDAWKLATPWDDSTEVGVEDGQQCNRYHEPDEDDPRGYKPKPCKGEMVEDHGVVTCNICHTIV